MKKNRKTQIVITAAQLFREKGYNAVSMRDLADKMNIRAASLYNHISSKQEILSLIILDIAKEFTAHMTKTVKLKETAIFKLEAIIKMHIDLTIRKSDALACMNSEWMHLNSEDLKVYSTMRDNYEKNFHHIIMQGINSGHFVACHSEVIVFSLLSTLRTLYLWYAKNQNFNPNDLKVDLTQTLIKGIKKQ